MEDKKSFNLPTETVKLPTRGLLYPKDNPLSKGEIEMKYMGAREEDILTNENYIDQGVVVDKLLQSLIVTPISYDDLFIGDKNAILIAARILGYGANYVFEYAPGKKTEINLSQLNEKTVDYSLFTSGINEFSFVLPNTQNTITFRLLTHRDEKAIEDEIKGLQKFNPNISTKVTTRLKHTITSVNGIRDVKSIREFVDNHLLAKDSKELRKYINSMSPNIDFVFYPEGSYAEEGIEIPITIDFFWPK